MVDIVRVSCGKKWTYVAVGSEAHDHVLRFSEKGLAHSTPVDVTLKSDAGPIFWELIGENNQSKEGRHSRILDCLTEGGIGVGLEEIRFGKHGNKYNPFADLSLVDNSSSKKGSNISKEGLSEDDIVITVWPSSKNLIPALATRTDRHFLLELVDKVPNGERCFVLDETGNLVTASLESNGSEFLRIVPTLAFASWLHASGCKASRDRRFTAKDHEGKILIEDRENEQMFMAPYSSNKKEIELRQVECLLAHGGLGAVIPEYVLENI